MLKQPSIFKVPTATSQATGLSKGCSSGFVTGGYYNENYIWIPTTCGGYSCSPFGSDCIDKSYCGTAFGVGTGIGGAVIVGIVVFT